MKLINYIVICCTFTLALGFTSNYSKKNTTSSVNLFKIERSKDNNQIFYDLNIDSTGVLNRKNPIHVYWLKNTEGGITKPLTWIQKKYAYGNPTIPQALGFFVTSYYIQYDINHYHVFVHPYLCSTF